MTREFDAAGEDVLVEHLRTVLQLCDATSGVLRNKYHAVLRKKGRVADEHFVQEDTECPPVDCLAVPLVEDDLGGKILRRAAQGPRPRRRLHVLGKAEVAQFEVARLVEQDVFGLEIAVEDVVGVEVLEHENDTGKARRQA